MHSKVKTILALVLFIALMGGAYFAYQALSEKNRPDLLGDSQNKNNPPSPTGSESNPSVSATPAAETPDQAPAEGQEEEVDKLAAIDFTVYDAEGNEVKLSDFFGKPIIMNFWTTWCPFCVEEMPVFEQAYQKYGDQIQFLMIDCVDGQRETQAMGEKFIQEKGFTFPVFYDTEGTASSTYEVYSLPTSVFLDRDGFVVIYFPGALTADMLQQGIDYILPQD